MIRASSIRCTRRIGMKSLALFAAGLLVGIVAIHTVTAQDRRAPRAQPRGDCRQGLRRGDGVLHQDLRAPRGLLVEAAGRAPNPNSAKRWTRTSSDPWRVYIPV